MRPPKAHLPQVALGSSSRKNGLPSPEALLKRQRLPRRLAAKTALATRENQGNLAPVSTGAVFLERGLWERDCDACFPEGCTLRKEFVFPLFIR